MEAAGVSVLVFKDDPVGNHWLLNMKCLPAWMFIRGLQFRTNTFGTRVAINRATGDGVVLHHNKPETLGHAPRDCTCTKEPRIARQNAIVKKVEGECMSKGLVVAREQSFLDDRGVLKKPDLVVKNKDKIYNADVMVVFENTNAVTEAAVRKKKN